MDICYIFHQICRWADWAFMVWSGLCSDDIERNRLLYSLVKNVLSTFLIMSKLPDISPIDVNFFRNVTFDIIFWTHGEYIHMMCMNLHHGSIFCWSAIDVDVFVDIWPSSLRLDHVINLLQLFFRCMVIARSILASFRSWIRIGPFFMEPAYVPFHKYIYGKSFWALGRD